jgi:hypothetical protein
LENTKNVLVLPADKKTNYETPIDRTDINRKLTDAKTQGKKLVTLSSIVISRKLGAPRRPDSISSSPSSTSDEMEIERDLFRPLRSQRMAMPTALGNNYSGDRITRKNNTGYYPDTPESNAYTQKLEELFRGPWRYNLE